MRQDAPHVRINKYVATTIDSRMNETILRIPFFGLSCIATIGSANKISFLTLLVVGGLLIRSLLSTKGETL